MAAGPLRDRVTFQRQALGVGDGAGNFGGDFANIAGCVGIAADIKPKGGSEVVLAAGVEGRRLFDVEIRYSSKLAGITVQDVMIDARDPTRKFNVKAPPVNGDGKQRFLQILVEQGGANG